jgi:hypothetical protein
LGYRNKACRCRLEIQSVQADFVCVAADDRRLALKLTPMSKRCAHTYLIGKYFFAIKNNKLL